MGVWSGLLVCSFARSVSCCRAGAWGQQLKINFSWIRGSDRIRRAAARTKAVEGISYWPGWQPERGWLYLPGRALCVIVIVSEAGAEAIPSLCLPLSTSLSLFLPSGKPRGPLPSCPQLIPQTNVEPILPKQKAYFHHKSALPSPLATELICMLIVQLERWRWHFPLSMQGRGKWGWGLQNDVRVCYCFRLVVSSVIMGLSHNGKWKWLI